MMKVDYNSLQDTSNRYETSILDVKRVKKVVIGNTTETLCFMR